MKSNSLLRTLRQAVFLVLGSLVLAACGGGSDNASPGSVVVEVPVECDDCGGGDGGGDDGGGTGGGGQTNPSTIPAALNSVITDSGTTASTAFANLPIFTIDVTALTGGALDPTGLVLGNDAIYQISGGALRVTAPSAGAACAFNLEPGAILVGASSTDFLVITQGCQIVADGTSDQPIIFTALEEVTGNVEASDRGLWGGVVINGFAPINDCPAGETGGTAGCTKEGEANSGLFGGDDPNDNSGILRYVSVRYAGSNVDPQNQLNGIAFQAVGDATVVEYVQVHNNLDDGIEFFGGTVNAKYIVLTGNDDDSLDWTDGWVGNLQYLYIEQTDGGDNAIEADNRSDEEDALPRSNPTIANMTVIGKSDERALRFRAGTAVTLYNSFVDGSERCIRVDGTSRDFLGAASDPAITIGGVSFACAQTHDGDTDGAVAAYLSSATNVSQTGEQVDPINIADTFFENTDYLGAFGSENWADGWTLDGSVSQTTQPDFGCPDGTTTSSRTIDGQRICQLSGDITSSLLLTSNNLYELVGKVTIGGDNVDSADLSIQAGTTIFGGTDVDFLVISRGSRILANGTRTAPVTFTSQSDVEGTVLATDRGLWGGLVINGNAPINDCPAGIDGGTAGCTKEGEANSGLFGGDVADDDSGRLNYVVVKYAGSNVDPQNQLNGIAFQGVGSATEVDYVQVHNNLDDGIEFFGGTVSARHVILTGNADDSLDWTDGWVGKIQYLIINQTDAGDSGIEADNRSDDPAVTPVSLPKIANMSINGNAASRAIRVRAGSGLELYNSTVQGNDRCFVVESAESLALLGTGIQLGGVSLDCVDPLDAAVQAEIDASENVSTDGTLVSAIDLSADDFFDNTTFVGAIENVDEDWTTGWAFGMPDASGVFGCPVGTTEIAAIDGTTTTCSLAGTYTTDLVLPRNNIYVLDGAVTIGGDNTDSAILDIQSGTEIVGDDPVDFLVISRGSQILARGTQNAPITFTAADDILGNIVNPTTTQGLWGGLVINGNAPINDCPAGIDGGTAGCTKEGEANSGTFGGDDPLDNSGVLNYVVVKFAGSNVDPQNQLNGIAFQGVGSGTEVDYIQVFNNLDDGVEFFGGTVNASHVVLIGNADDSLDWTDGWVGSLQYLHIEQTAGGDNSIEADNRSDDELATPISEPTIANMTIVGDAAQRAIRLRVGTGLHLYNSEVSGSDRCLEVSGVASLSYLGSRITFDSVGLGCSTIVDGGDADVQAFLDGSTNVTQDGSTPTPVTLPAGLDPAGDSIIGSDISDWGQGWTVGVPALSGN
jgi:hypothetical protein